MDQWDTSDEQQGNRILWDRYRAKPGQKVPSLAPLGSPLDQDSVAQARSAMRVLQIGCPGEAPCRSRPRAISTRRSASLRFEASGRGSAVLQAAEVTAGPFRTRLQHGRRTVSGTGIVSPSPIFSVPCPAGQLRWSDWHTGTSTHRNGIKAGKVQRAKYIRLGQCGCRADARQPLSRDRGGRLPRCQFGPRQTGWFLHVPFLRAGNGFPLPSRCYNPWHSQSAPPEYTMEYRLRPPEAEQERGRERAT